MMKKDTPLGEPVK